MKYINRYNDFHEVNKSIKLFEDLNPLPKLPKRKSAEHVDIYEIEERTYDLQDYGFTVVVNPYLGSEWEKGYRYKIDIIRSEYFNMSMIDEHLEHLENFMKSKGYILKRGRQSNEVYHGLFHNTVYFIDKNLSVGYRISIINKQLGIEDNDKMLESEVLESVQSEVLEDLKDICLELTDDDFRLSTYLSKKSPKGKETSNWKSGHLTIEYPQGPKTFNYDKVEEVVKRMKEYLGYRFDNIDFFTPRVISSGWVGKDEYFDLSAVRIYFNL